MNDNQILASIRNFIGKWNGRGSEKSDAHLFWLDLLGALGLADPTQAVELEKEVNVNGHTCFIDVFIPSTKVLIEQKSRGIDLDKPARQSDGSFFTPFDQAKRYADELPYSRRPRWIVTCNFDEFRIYDLDRLPTNQNSQTVKPQIIKFIHLALNYKRLMFLVDPNDENIEEVKISKDAVNIIAAIRRAFARKMLAPRNPVGDPVSFLSLEQRTSLNKFCVRLVFCLYAEDANVFAPNQFVDYIQAAADQSQALVALFNVLAQPLDRRDPNLPADLAAFPCVNGGLFDCNALDIPPFDNVTSHSITLEANDSKINWFAINPTIFGALFESNLNEDTRRAGGMHFTSRENILKLINPLFLDELHDEFDSIKRKRKQNRQRALEDFQNKIASLKFLDPACGSGNFLTETYIKLRELENDVLRELLKLDVACTIKVSIDQFYGIEVNDFACAVAQTAMWISESKMLYDTDVGIRERIQYLPLKHSARIVCGNALTLDWNDVAPDGVDYIIGNPPFVGASMMSAKQKAEAVEIFGKGRLVNSIDYVGAWFHKAAALMVGNQTRAAFVSTNSITQGEQVAPLWQKLFVERGIHIDFAHRTFKWLSESEDMAAVHCVIVGFSCAPNDRPRLIFDGDEKIAASNINPYLVDAPDVFIWSRAKPICPDAPRMTRGNMPADGGYLILSTEERDRLLKDDPALDYCIRPYIVAKDFLNGGASRYCLWLKDIDPKIYRGNQEIMRRLDAVQRFRAKSTAKPTRDMAAHPQLFFHAPQPTTNYLCIPRVSSERRKYIPIGFMQADVIVGDAMSILPSATLFHFGVLSSSVHMAWVRVVCGRLKSDYRYSTSVVYNNYPWCAPSSSIERTAQSILDARALYPTRTLAALYDPNDMPDELRAAHEENDRAVLSAYGFDVSMSEAEVVSRLMSLYSSLLVDTKNI
ncbi:MAG: class I SAM-dependent DNA methyltransferase [Selenomonadaceae bacterium]|nr:class I SAM-dependent DNA methyltransferase [Selenomonadaceae bacterium]